MLSPSILCCSHIIWIKTILPERQTSHNNTYIWNLERWYWSSYLQGSKRDADIKNRLLVTVGEGESEMTWESSIETYTLSYVKYTASGNLLYDAGNPKLCDNLEGWDGEGGLRISLWLIYADVWQKPSQYCKIIIFQLKKKGSFSCDSTVLHGLVKLSQHFQSMSMHIFFFFAISLLFMMQINVTECVLEP